ncbi:RNA polymerase sigma factor [Allostreptomyces psammosilenae]|uniref:RNA polymerase sigma-70 factor (ECF subfamily) n=1 Tax=Allostreptomyces psammosilenae TaxID=1892865 RepID=A0A852ZTF7_9ACTN|nr:sigma-70 family RNA polymerase sigma factor [Allostreptomyces psammosilenae]NYI04560.1 RNA polymerase sigma-70 factor (ECF subfamily) [Allostreptomyces psammosilenae]
MTTDEDERRFVEWYEAYYADISAYMRRRLPEAQVADAVADVFLVAWRRQGEVPRERPLPWLYGVARRTVANLRRRGDRSRDLLEVLGRTSSGTLPDPAGELSTRLAVVRAFGQLSELEQEVLRLALWEGLSTREGAKVLSCAPATYAMRLHRARRRLRRLLEDEPSAEPPTQPLPTVTTVQ